MLPGSLALAHIDVQCDRVGMVALAPLTLACVAHDMGSGSD
jgi:hypothetical protein